MSGWTEASLSGDAPSRSGLHLTGELTPSPVVRRSANKDNDKDGAKEMSALAGRRVDPWEVAYFNGAAVLDEIPVRGRADNVEQVAFRGPSEQLPKVRRE